MAQICALKAMPIIFVLSLTSIKSSQGVCHKDLGLITTDAV